MLIWYPGLSGSDPVELVITLNHYLCNESVWLVPGTSEDE